MTVYTQYSTYPKFNDVYVTNSVSIGDDLTVADDVTIAGDLSVSGDFTFGNASTDSLVVVGLLHTRSKVSHESEVTFNAGGVVMDDQKLYFGTNKDCQLEYDEDGTNQLRYDGANMVFDTATALVFRDSAIYVNSSAVDTLDVVSDGIIQCTTAPASNATGFLVKSATTNFFAIEYIDGITNDTALVLGGAYYWTNSAGSFVYASTRPTSDASGAAVGAQEA